MSKNSIEKIANKLLNLEINTIITDCITAEKMSPPGKVLPEIIDWYEKKLHDLKVDFYKSELVDSSRFKSIADNAKKALDDYNENNVTANDVDNSNWFLLNRLRTYSEQIALAIEGKNIDNWEKELQPKDCVLIRKAWELGVDEIALQTVIQIDGDVITRVNRKYANSNEICKTLQTIHHESVGVCMERWKEIISAARLFFQSIIKTIWM